MIPRRAIFLLLPALALLRCGPPPPKPPPVLTITLVGSADQNAAPIGRLYVYKLSN